MGKYDIDKNYDRDFRPANFRVLWELLRGSYSWFALCLVLAVAGALLDVAAGYFIKEFTNSGLSGDFGRLISGISLFAGLFAVNGGVKFLLRYTGGRYTFGAVEGLRNRIFKTILRLPNAQIESRHSSDFVTPILNDIRDMEQFLMRYTVDLVYAPLAFFVSFVFLLWINPWLTIASVAPVPVLLALSGILSRPVAMCVGEIREGQSGINGIARQTAENMDTVKIFRLGDYFAGKFNKAVGKEMDGYLRKNFIAVCLQPLAILSWNLPLFITLAWGSFLILRDSLTAGDLFAFLYLLQYMTKPLQRVPDMIAEVRGISVTAGRIRDVLETPPEEEGGEASVPEMSDPVIKAENLSFSYNGETPVLRDVSFEIPRGKIFALVGESGCGKSTLFKLIMGLYPPDSGKLELFGRDYSRWQVNALRDQFSLVDQHPFLFPVSLGENISYGNPVASPERIEEACNMANAAGFIGKLPDGLDTCAGERGARLSGGERQRVTIARALLKDAPVLLLDEPTASLDTQSEALIQEALSRIMKDRTAIIVAHRLSTVREADTILVMEGGRIAEKGSHGELMERKGLYHDLYVRQDGDS